MGLFNVLKRKEVPKELPSLSLSSASQGSSVSQQSPKSSVLESIKRRSEEASQSPVAQKPVSEMRFKALPVQKSDFVPRNSSEEDRGFFRELMKDLTEDIDDTKLKGIDKNKLLSEDIVSQMKEYWHTQKPEILLKTVGGDLKQKLLEKTDDLHTLEKEWQDAYFELVTKEDKIRKEERELKKLLGDLMELYEKSMETSKSADLSKKEFSPEKKEE